MRLLLLFTMVALVAGCARDREEELGYIPRVDPPAFLNQSLAGLFAGQNFSARVQVTTGAKTMVGELSARDGNIFFKAGEIAALWDAKSQKAYLFNDPLQAYAPITTDTNQAIALQKDGLSPTRIQVGPSTIVLEAIKRNPPPAELFVLPSGFKSFESTEAMLNELELRRRDLIRARNEERYRKYGGSDAPAPVTPPPRY